MGITPAKASSLSELPGLYGFALDSGDEIKPGLRDFDQLAAILESLELEDSKKSKHGSMLGSQISIYSNLPKVS